MHQVNCPCCGANLRVVVEAVSALDLLGPKSRPAKSEYATVRDSVPRPVVPAPLPKVPEPMYRINTDVGAFRQALHDAGFVKQAEDGAIFNDKNVDSRRLKLYFGGAVADASKAQKEKLGDALKKYFGERLLEHGPYIGGCWRGPYTAYIVRLGLK